MLKSNNKYLKISNIIFLVLAALSLTSILSMLIRGYKNIKGLTAQSYYMDLIMFIIYLVVSIFILYITNKKVELYKQEYPKSRKIFNIFACLSFLSTILMLSSNILNYIIYNQFLLYSLLSIILGYMIPLIVSYYIVSKGKILNSDNSTNINVSNFIVIILLMNYAANVIILILQMIFNINDIVLVFREIILSLIFVCLILIAYKLVNKRK